MKKVIWLSLIFTAFLASGCASTGPSATSTLDSATASNDSCYIGFLTLIFVDKAPECYYRQILEDIKKPFGEQVKDVELPEIVVLDSKTFENVYTLLCDLKGCEARLEADRVAAFHYRGYVFFRTKNAWGYEVIAHELAHFLSLEWKDRWMEEAVIDMAGDFAFYTPDEAREVVERMRAEEDATMLLRENFASGIGRYYAWMQKDRSARIFDTQ